MKKFMFFALASAAMLASCSSDDSVAVDEVNVAQTQDGPVAIQIGLGGSVFTRGTGTVGGVAGSNTWANEKFNLYMLQTGTMKLATKNNLETEGDDDAIYNNFEFDAPDTETGIATPNDHSVKYYPATGVYDFWAYRLDGAQGTAKPTINTTDITVPFTIDGSQDILVAKAKPADPSTVTVPYYSARAARKGIQPEMIFRHLLSRLKFTVAPGNKITADPTAPVVITAIKAKSAINGTLTIAATGDTDGSCQAITWGTAETDFAFVSVMQRDGDNDGTVDDIANTPLKPLDEVSLFDAWDNVNDKAIFKPVGEALLVSPSTTDYELEIEGYQQVNVGTATPETRNFTQSLKAPVPAGGFVAGTSYNVQIVVYGLEQIKVYVTLTPWGEVTLDAIGQDE